MKKFSNESKKRWKAILKTILKRYSIFIWLPMLLYVFYIVGLKTFMLIDGGNVVSYEELKSFRWILPNLQIGFFVSLLIITVIIGIIGCCIEFFEYLEKRTLLYDIEEIIKAIAEEITSWGCSIVKLPKKIYNRIKSEPERFKTDLNKELTKQE